MTPRYVQPSSTPGASLCMHLGQLCMTCVPESAGGAASGTTTTTRYVQPATCSSPRTHSAPATTGPASVDLLHAWVCKEHKVRVLLWSAVNETMCAGTCEKPAQQQCICPARALWQQQQHVHSCNSLLNERDGVLMLMHPSGGQGAAHSQTQSSKCSSSVNTPMCNS